MALNLDHIGIVARDLAALENDYRRLGFHVAPRCELVGVEPDGTPRPLGQSNSHLVFADTYVELTAVHGDLSTHHLRDAIARYFGFHIVVFRTDDADRDNLMLKEKGITVDPVGQAGRAVQYPTAEGLAQFKWFRLPEKVAPDAFFCYVEHVTPEMVFDSKLNRHANGARQLTGITLCVADPAQSAAELADLVGGAPLNGEDDFGLTLPNGGVVTFLTPSALAQRYPDTVVPRLPFAAAFHVRCEDLESTRGYFKEAGVDIQREDDTVWVPAQLAGGVVVEFAATSSG